MRVGVFDSGIGGLTILKNLYKNYPDNEYIYYGDTLNLPYGSKTKEELNKLASKDVEFLLQKEVDLIIIACGTVSSNCLEYLKENYNIPIYDIISPTLEYLNSSNYENIGIIATERTIDSHMFKNNLNKNVYEIKTPGFVPIIEENKTDILESTIASYLKDYKDKLDILVLGCTHYPIIKKELQNYLSNKVDLLDMSYPLLNKLTNGNKSSLNIYYSKLNDKVIKNTKRILEQTNLNIYEEQ